MIDYQNDIDNIQGMTDRDILSGLNSLGIEISIPEFKNVAAKTGTPTALAEIWSKLPYAQKTSWDFLSETTLELWKRHLSHIKCPEILSDFICDTIDIYDNNFHELNKTILLDIYERIKKIYHDLIREDGSPDIDLYCEVNEYTQHNFETFLLDIPFEFERNGLIDEAVSIGRWFAEISPYPEIFLRDIGCILASAGRRKEAMRQIRKDLRKFPSDVWITIMAGDAMFALGETKAAEEFFLKALEISSKRYEKEDALERLIDFYKKMGMREKAMVFELEYRTVIDS
jgi:tetratricopeptide (TPR) repeat protein